MKTIKKYRNVVLRLLDVLIIAFAYIVAKVIVIQVNDTSKQIILYTILVSIVIYSSMLHIFKTYKNKS